MVIPEFRRQKFFNTSAGTPGVDLSGAQMAETAATSQQQVVNSRAGVANQMSNMGDMLAQRMRSIGNTIAREMEKKERAINDLDADSKASQFGLEYNRRVQDAKAEFQDNPEAYEQRVAEIGKEYSEEFLSGIDNQYVKGEVAKYSSSIQARSLMQAKAWTEDRRIANAGLQMEKFMDNKIAAINEIPVDGRDLDTLKMHLREASIFAKKNGKNILAPEKAYAYERELMSRMTEAYVMRGMRDDPDRMLKLLNSGALSKINWGKGPDGNDVIEPLINDPRSILQLKDRAEHESALSKQEKLEQNYIDTRNKVFSIFGGEATTEDLVAHTRYVHQTGTKEEIDRWDNAVDRLNRNQLYRAEHRNAGTLRTLQEAAHGLSKKGLNVKDYPTLVAFDNQVLEAFARGEIDQKDINSLMKNVHLLNLREKVREANKQEKPGWVGRFIRGTFAETWNEYFVDSVGGTKKTFDNRSPEQFVMHTLADKIDNIRATQPVKDGIANYLYTHIPEVMENMDSTPGKKGITVEKQNEIFKLIDKNIEQMLRAKIGNGDIQDAHGNLLEDDGK